MELGQVVAAEREIGDGKFVPGCAEIRFEIKEPLKRRDSGLIVAGRNGSSGVSEQRVRVVRVRKHSLESGVLFCNLLSLCGNTTCAHGNSCESSRGQFRTVRNIGIQRRPS